LLSGPEECELARRYARGDLQAKERMICSNLRLVVSIARFYGRLSTLTLAELCHEGVIGLMRAVEKFDWRRGLRFSTYAVPWIRQAIQRAVFDRGSEIRIPVNVAQRQLKLRKCGLQLAAELGREPTSEELAAHAGMTVAEITALDDLPWVSSSLDAPAVDDDGPTLADRVALGQPGPEREVLANDWASSVRSLLDRLPSAEARAVSAEFELGPEDQEPKDRRATRAARAALIRRALDRLATYPYTAELRAGA
jgi:RNA polymerase primary sigma factor